MGLWCGQFYCPENKRLLINSHLYLFCIYTPHPHCWVAMLGQGLSLLWAGTGWESCAAGQVSELGARSTKLANSTAHREEAKERMRGEDTKQKSWEVLFNASKTSQEVRHCVGSLKLVLAKPFKTWSINIWSESLASWTTLLSDVCCVEITANQSFPVSVMCNKTTSISTAVLSISVIFMYCHLISGSSQSCTRLWMCVCGTCVSCCGGVASMDTVLLSLVKNLSARCPRPDLLAHSMTIRKHAWICNTLERWNQPRDGPAQTHRHTKVGVWLSYFIRHCSRFQSLDVCMREREQCVSMHVRVFYDNMVWVFFAFLQRNNNNSHQPPAPCRIQIDCCRGAQLTGFVFYCTANRHTACILHSV